MDEDELLAIRLQAEELLADTNAQELRQQLKNSYGFVLQAENQELQALARSKMPVSKLKEAAYATWLLNQPQPGDGAGSSSNLNEEDYLVQELLVWFKAWFSWVDCPPCDECGSASVSLGPVKPNAQEASHAASRTELFTCQQCRAEVRFPRYNSVAKLLETRRGRCGEWANAFLTCCRALGIDARYIHDSTDHVWTEYWSAAQGRWIHLDSCEAAYDKPLLYEAGWGKQLQYVTAIGTDGYVDVIHRYSQKWQQVSARRHQVTEEQLTWVLMDLTAELRQGWPADRLQAAAARDKQEQQALALRRDGHVSAADLVGLGARTSGSEDWVRSRGEAGAQAGAAPAAAPPPPPCTPWSAVPKSLWSTFKKGGDEVDVFQAAGRLVGGGARARAENGRHEGAARAFDGDVDTKWLDFNKTSWLEYRLLPGQGPVELVGYDVVSANDFPSRDPRDWVVEGLVPGDTPGAAGTWVQLDKQQGVMFNSRHELRCFWVGCDGDVSRTGQEQAGADVARAHGPVKCVGWRLTVSATRHPEPDCLQLSCWNLYTRGSDASMQAGAYPGSEAAAAQAAEQLVAGQGDAALPPLLLTLLVKLLQPITSDPTSYKPLMAQRLVSLWSHVPTMTVLFAVGLRPVIKLGPKPCVQAAASHGVGGAGMLRGGLPPVPPEEMVKDVFMVVDADTAAAAARAKAVLAVLRPA